MVDPNVLAAVFATLDRQTVAAFVEFGHVVLDLMDGDRDREPDGDDLGDVGEAEWSPRGRRKLPEHRDADAYLAQSEDDEQDGDEEDHNNSEDDFVKHCGTGPGCPISDNDHGAEDKPEDRSWTEWHTRGRHKLDSNGSEARPPLPNRWYADHEDAEDDDRDSCMALDDDPARRVSDGLPGDPGDTENGHDAEQCVGDQ